jgi:hypothetical protein
VREVREVREALLDKVRRDGLRLAGGGKPLKLPDELTERQVPAAVPGMGYVVEDQSLQGLGAVPVWARGLARYVLLDEAFKGAFVNIGPV